MDWSSKLEASYKRKTLKQQTRDSGNLKMRPEYSLSVGTSPCLQLEHVYTSGLPSNLVNIYLENRDKTQSIHHIIRWIGPVSFEPLRSGAIGVSEKNNVIPPQQRSEFLRFLVLK